MRGGQKAKRKQMTPHLDPLPRGERKKRTKGRFPLPGGERKKKPKIGSLSQKGEEGRNGDECPHPET